VDRLKERVEVVEGAAALEDPVLASGQVAFSEDIQVRLRHVSDSLNRELPAGSSHILCRARYGSQVQQQPLTAIRQHNRQHTQLAGTPAKYPAVRLVRDEEAVPVTSDGPGQRLVLAVTPGQPGTPAHLRAGRLTRCAYRPSEQRVNRQSGGTKGCSTAAKLVENHPDAAASLGYRPGRRPSAAQSWAACLACGSSGPRIAARAVPSCRAASRSTIMAM